MNEASAEFSVDQQFYTAALREELARVNHERVVLRAALEQQAAHLDALRAAHGEAIAELQRLRHAGRDEAAVA